MIYVIATIGVKAGRMRDFIEIFKSNAPIVRAETGCIEYIPAVDANSGLSAQNMDENRVTVIEKWESLEALDAHLKTPHMLAYRKRVEDMVTGVSLRVLKNA